MTSWVQSRANTARTRARAGSGTAQNWSRAIGGVVSGTPGTRPTQGQTDAWKWYVGQTGPTANRSSQFSTEGWKGFRDTYVPGGGAFTAPTSPGTSSRGGSGGGYGGGYGGGGGGGSAITQAMIDAMGQALGAGGGQLQLQQSDLPAFQGQELGAFNAAPYTQALGSIDTAVGQDEANIAANQAQVAQNLQNNYTNAYAGVQATPSQQVQQPGAALMGGGIPNQSAANQVNAEGANQQAGFANLLKVLAAADQTSQASRMNQVSQDANYARQNLGAQATGMRGQVGAQQAQAQNAWQQQAAERQYQNSLMAQQWQREAMQRQQDLANQQAQANWTQGNTNITSRLQPILDLISQSGGQSGLNFAPLLRALGVGA